MKRFIGVLVCAFIINGCDDGDLTVDTINFDDVEARSCDSSPTDGDPNFSDDNIIYKIRDTEVLLLQISAADAFINVPTTPATLRSFPIGDVNKVFYNAYSGTVTSSSFCGSLPAITPIVTEQWTAVDGVIEISTLPVTTTITDENNDFFGGTRVNNYRHTISFRNITFQKPEGEQRYETFNFGTYDTSVNQKLFAFDNQSDIDKCPQSNVIYNVAGREALALNIDSQLLQNVPTPPNQPRTGIVGTATNQLSYTLFNNDGALADYFCQTSAPAFPTILERWTAINGVSGVSGIIEVTTTTEGSSQFRHEIRLKNITLERDNVQFLLATDYFFGTFVTSN